MLNNIVTFALVIEGITCFKWLSGVPDREKFISMTVRIIQEYDRKYNAVLIEDDGRVLNDSRANVPGQASYGRLRVLLRINSHITIPVLAEISFKKKGYRRYAELKV